VLGDDDIAMLLEHLAGACAAAGIHGNDDGLRRGIALQRLTQGAIDFVPGLSV